MGLEDFDIFPKLRDDFNRKTAISGTITTVCVGLMAYLFVSQSMTYFLTPPGQRMFIKHVPLPTDAKGYLAVSELPTLRVTLDLTLHSLPCAFVDVGTIDEFKEINDDVMAQIKMKRYDRNGNRLPKETHPEQAPLPGCGSCYGAAAGCCNTCKEVKKAFKLKGKPMPPLSTIDQCKPIIDKYLAMANESCRITGKLEVPPARGTIFIAPGDSYNVKGKHYLDYKSLGVGINEFNMSHTLHSVQLGNTVAMKDRAHYQSESGRMKTIYNFRAVRVVDHGRVSYQVSSNDYSRYREGTSQKFPAVYFEYSVSPIIVTHKRKVSILHFIVDLMAILGGVFSLGSLVDRILSRSVGPRKPRALN